VRYYVVSDVHGYYTILRDTLESVGFFNDIEPHKLILCGDLLDRGQEANRITDFMAELMKQNMLIYILGNHEELLVECLYDIKDGGVHEIAGGMSHHYYNKTWDSLLQIAEMDEKDACSYPMTLVKRVVGSRLFEEVLPHAIDYYETKNYIFTHGWIPCFTEGAKPNLRFSYNPDWRNADNDSWVRARWYNGMIAACKYEATEPDKTIVCGHFNSSYGHSRIHCKCTEWGRDADFSPFYDKGIIAIDASVANTGKINCIIIED